MDVVAAWSFANLAWLATQAVPLIAAPSLIASLLREEAASPTALEMYFARALGLALLSLGLTSVLLSGAIPLGSSVDAPQKGISPYAKAVLLVSVLHHTASGFHCYSRYAWTSESGFLLGGLGGAALALAGLYCVMFAGDDAMVSRHHKFAQDTSGWPFKNSQSYRARKKAL